VSFIERCALQPRRAELRTLKFRQVEGGALKLHKEERGPLKLGPGKIRLREYRAI